MSTAKQDHQNQLEIRTIDLFEKTYGSHRLSAAFKDEGIQVGRHKVGRLMSKPGLQVRYPKRFKLITNSNHNDIISPKFIE